MKLKWNNLSILLGVGLGLVIVGVFIFGQIYFLNPIKEQANNLSQQVEEQKKLKTNYPPDMASQNVYKKEYEKTWEFLPEGERANQELVVLEELAAKEKVAVQQVVRLEEPQSVEGLDERYKKNSYEVSLTSANAESIQKLMEELENLERTWNIHTVSFEKNDAGSFSGTFTFELFYYLTSAK